MSFMIIVFFSIGGRAQDTIISRTNTKLCIGCPRTIDTIVAHQMYPLFRLLQLHYDSIVVLSSFDGWSDPYNFQIVAKKGTGVSTFIYANPYPSRMGVWYAPQIRDIFYRRSVPFVHAAPDTSIAFRPYFVKEPRHLWHQLQVQRLWQLKAVEEKGNICNIYDDIEERWYLLAGSKTRVIHFYGANFFETCNPPNPDRTMHIKTRNLLIESFYRAK